MVFILKKAIILSLALTLCFAAHLRPCCDFLVAGEYTAAGCSLSAMKSAKQAALMAAEEILPGGAELPEAKCRWRLVLSERAETAPALTDTLLRHTPGIISGSVLYLDGKPLGLLSEDEAFIPALENYIDNTLPTWANSGSIHGSIILLPCYSRMEYSVSAEDMILLVTGISPVMYSDGNGRVSPV